jgi:hypothetical protein
MMGDEIGRKLQSNDAIYIVESQILAKQNLLNDALCGLVAKGHAQEFGFNTGSCIQTCHKLVCEFLGAPSDKGRRII